MNFQIENKISHLEKTKDCPKYLTMIHNVKGFYNYFINNFILIISWKRPPKMQNSLKFCLFKL